LNVKSAYAEEEEEEKEEEDNEEKKKKKKNVTRKIQIFSILKKKTVLFVQET
jgi:hypothetical protein